MEQEFYMTLSSNNKTESDNTIALFDTQLDRTYEFDSNWYVGLAEMSYTRSWFNVKKDEPIMLVSSREVLYPTGERLKAGFYRNEQELAEAINSIVIRIANDGIVSYPSISCDIYSHRCNVAHGINDEGHELYLWIGEDLAEMLGLKFQGPRETNAIDEEIGRAHV